MNTPLKFDHDPRRPDPEPLKFDLEMRPRIRKRTRKQPNIQLECLDYRAHYEDLAVHWLSSIVRHRWFIAKFAVVALALACISISLLPRKYSAEALIYPRLSTPERDKVVALASVDGAAVVAGEARLIRSDAVLRAVAMRLGHDPGEKPRSWPALTLDRLRTALLPETRNHSPFDRTISLLRNRVVVMNDTRSYLISISFTAPTADQAAQVVNAFVTEYLRYKARQRRLEKIDHAEVELRQQLAVYGDKHPKVLHAMAELEAERAVVEAAINAQNGDQDDVANDRSVRLAVPNQTPTSPRGAVILGLSFLFALLAGIGLAVWRDRRAARKQFPAASPIART